MPRLPVMCWPYPYSDFMPPPKVYLTALKRAVAAGRPVKASALERAEAAVAAGSWKDDPGFQTDPKRPELTRLESK